MARKLISKIKSWSKVNKWELILLCSVLIVSAVMRLYHIDQYLTFLGDEGRDVIIVRRFLVNFDPILIGPGTSIGNMYLGPLYYYLIAPSLFIANYSPVGPAVFIAFMGIATVFLVWFIAREWFGKTAALIASLLYATSPIVIIYSRSSWNPNIMPFFALLCIYSVWRLWRFFEYPWLIVLGIAYAFVLQSHYLGLLLFPVLMFFYVLTVIRLRVTSYGFREVKVSKAGKASKVSKDNYAGKLLLIYSFIGLLLFLFLMSPLVIFDARHGWRNFSAIKLFFTQRQETVSIKPWAAIPKMGDLINKIISRLVAGTDMERGGKVVAGFGLAMLSLLVLFKKVAAEKKYAFYLLFVWLTFALVGLGVYKQEIYDHYYGFFFPAPFILLGGIIQTIEDRKKWIGLIIAFPVTLYLLTLNIKNTPLQFAPNRQLQRSEAVSQRIVTESQGKPFNIAVIADRNYEGAYQYYLERRNEPLVAIDPQRYKETLTDQLFVVCELPHDKCDPTHNPKAEVANFGWSKIDGQWEVEGVILYKLVHTK